MSTITPDAPPTVREARRRLQNTSQLSSDQVDQLTSVIASFHASRPTGQCVACGGMIWTEHATADGNACWACGACHRPASLTPEAWQKQRQAAEAAREAAEARTAAEAPAPRAALGGIALPEQLREAAEHDGSELSLGLAANAQFVTPQFRGEFIAAEQRLVWGEAYLAAPGLSQFFAAGWTTSIAGWNAWILGWPDQARGRIRRAFATIDDDAYSQASVRWVAAKLHVMLREAEQAASIAGQAIALADERGSTR
jgi:hypothetical protein